MEQLDWMMVVQWLKHKKAFVKITMLNQFQEAHVSYEKASRREMVEISYQITTWIVFICASLNHEFIQRFVAWTGAEH